MILVTIHIYKTPSNKYSKNVFIFAEVENKPDMERWKVPTAICESLKTKQYWALKRWLGI